MKKTYATLFLIGLSLSIAQFIMVRDFVSILYGEEIVIVLVTASFFVGLSVGYFLSLRCPPRVFRVLFIVAAFLHLTFPFSYRYIAAALSSQDASGWTFLALLFGYALVFNSIFAAVLPRLISLPETKNTTELQRLRTYYSIELLGFMSGFAIVAISWNKPLVYLLAPYWLTLAVLLQLNIARVMITAIYAVLAMVLVLNLGDLDYASTSALYAEKHNIRGAKTLYSVNSPYQKVEVIENRRGNRYLYLDGLQNLNSTDLDALNYYIAVVPARLLQPRHILLIGNGTLSSVPKVYPYAQFVTSVELDPAVLAAGKAFFTSPEKLEGLDNWTLHVDDGKHFLRKTQERFDLVVVDVPSPLTIQEAYLHSVEFYRLVSERLTETGMLSVQLSGPLQKNNRTPARVTAALRAVFDQVMVVDSDKADRSFAYAAQVLQFDGDAVHRETRGYEKSIDIIAPADVDAFLVNAEPLSVNSMDLVLRRGLERFVDRYFDD